MKIRKSHKLFTGVVLATCVFFCLLTSSSLATDTQTIDISSNDTYSTLDRQSTTYDCKSNDTNGCKATGDSKIKLESSYEYHNQTISYCNYIMSVNNGVSLFIPAKTQAEYQSFLTWAANNANVLTFHAGCDNGGWGPWTGCEGACGNCTETRQCYYLNNAQYAGTPCVGDSRRNITATAGCTYTPGYAACPSACGSAASTLSPTSCLRSDGVSVDLSFCPQTKTCDAVNCPCEQVETIYAGGVYNQYSSGTYPTAVNFVLQICADDLNYSYRKDGGPWEGSCAGNVAWGCNASDGNDNLNCVDIRVSAKHLDVTSWDGGGGHDPSEIRGYAYRGNGCVSVNGGWNSGSQCYPYYSGSCAGYKVISCNNPTPAFGGNSCGLPYYYAPCDMGPSAPECFCVYNSSHDACYVPPPDYR